MVLGPNIFNLLFESTKFELVLQVVHEDQIFQLFLVPLIMTIKRDFDFSFSPFCLFHDVDNQVLSLGLKMDSTHAGDPIDLIGFWPLRGSIRNPR